MTSAALLLALSGCGDDTSPEPDLDPKPTEETSAAEPTDATGTTEPAEPFDADGDELHRGRIKADNTAEEAVAEAWLAYWQVRLTAYHKVKVDSEALGEVAKDDALQEVIAYVGYLRDHGLHSEGDLKVGISDIEVSGSVAAVRSCMDNKAMDVDDDGEAGEDLVPYANVVGTLSKVGSQWVVSVKEVTGDKKCKA